MEYKLFSSSSGLIFLNFSKNVIKVDSHFSSLYSVFNVFQFVSGQKRHQGFRGKSGDNEIVKYPTFLPFAIIITLPVLGSLLVISHISHVSVDLVTSSENVMNNFS